MKLLSRHNNIYKLIYTTGNISYDQKWIMKKYEIAIKWELFTVEP